MSWPGLITFGALVQALVIIAMRQYDIGFWRLLPLMILMQWFFMEAYANKGSPFTLIWFSAAGLTTAVSLLMGVLLFQDRLGQLQVAGLVLVVLGLILVRVY